MSTFRRTLTAIAAVCLVSSHVTAQQAVMRLKGRVTTERGEPITGAEVRAEAFYGFAAGTFAGQRTYSERTNAKGEWSMGTLQPGIWLFEVVTPEFMPETVVLPLRILTTVSSGVSGLMLDWQLVLKPVPPPEGSRSEILKGALEAARAKNADQVRAMLNYVPDDANADFLAAAGRISLLARDNALAQALFLRALERDPASYRAALGVASLLLLQRDFDKASRAFDATRNRTHDKDEMRFLSAAIGDLATVKVR
jgi:tetratricopeptide (TPR) repeat protein